MIGIKKAKCLNRRYTKFILMEIDANFGKTNQQVKKIGNSLYIRIPKSECVALGIEEKDFLIVWFRKK